MGPWPFDRLLEAVRPLCADHSVTVQSGTSEVRLPCRQVPFLSYEEEIKSLEDADVVITHAGNTVRLVQRLNKLPIAVAREQARGEMRNDHQVRFAQEEHRLGRAVSLSGDVQKLRTELVDLVKHGSWFMDSGALPTPASPNMAALLDGLEELCERPTVLSDHPTARYGWAFAQLHNREGEHLDLGIGDATFLKELVDHTRLRVTGADPHVGNLSAAHKVLPHARLVRVGERLPFASQTFDSVSFLDVLEHTPDDEAACSEIARVLRPGGLLVMSVPAKHVFSFLDPDNAKFHFPRLHRRVYSAWFGRETYQQRFEDSSDGLRGDMAWDRQEHTNYQPERIVQLLLRHGLTPLTRDGANLFWRFFQVPALLMPTRLGHAFDRPLRWDGRHFARANLFITATKVSVNTPSKSDSGSASEQ